MGIKCTPRCRCEDCQNDGQDPAERDGIAKNIITTKKTVEDKKLASVDFEILQSNPPSHIEFNPSEDIEKNRGIEAQRDVFNPAKLSSIALPVDFAHDAPMSYCLMDCIVPLMTEAHYVNLDALMQQFFTVPFLEDFCRSYQSQNQQSIANDLMVVRQRIKNRMYTSGRSLFLDVITVIRNGANNQMGASISPRVISAKMDHLTEYFSTLWLEYMLPSDIPYFPLAYHDNRSPSPEQPIPSEQDEDNSSIGT
jgi:hypothetical protein